MTEREHHNIPRTSFFAAVGLPISWVLAVINLVRKPQREAERRWLWALIALAVFDVLVITSLILVSKNIKELSALLRPQPAQSAIGVVVGERPLDVGLKVESVAQASPATAANIVPGDVIDTCDGKAVRSAAQLRRCVGQHKPGELVHLRVLRGESVRDDVPVLTRSPADLRGPIVAPIQQVDACQARMKAPPLGALSAWILFVLLGAFAWLRKGGPAALLLALGIGLIAMLGTYSTAALCMVGIPEGMRELLELPLSPLSLLLLAFLVNRFALGREAPPVISGAPHWYVTAGLAIWTHLFMMFRLAFVIAAAVLVFELGPIEATPVEEIISGGARTGATKALFFLTAAVLAPIAEEYFFRGVAITSLARVMRPLFAIVAVALVFGLLHGGYGVRTPIVVSLGLILGWARWESRGLNAPIALHFAQNAVVSLLFLAR